MAGPENTFIASVHRHLPKDLYRMKNHNQFNGGIADVWYSGRRADMWVEYKFVVVPARSTTPIVFGLSALQEEWLKSRHAEGRSVGVLVGCKAGGVWYPGVSWDTTHDAKSFCSQVLSRTDLADVINNLVS
jgi:hypothetical protein